MRGETEMNKPIIKHCFNCKYSCESAKNIINAYDGSIFRKEPIKVCEICHPRLRAIFCKYYCERSKVK